MEKKNDKKKKKINKRNIGMKIVAYLMLIVMILSLFSVAISVLAN